MLKRECINLDAVLLNHKGSCTDIVADIFSVDFPENLFSGIVTFHFLEHFFKSDTLKILSLFFKWLRKGGKLVVECPDILGCYKYYVQVKKDLVAYSDAIYGREETSKLYKEGNWHKSGWTGDLMAEEMKKIGFKITHIGIGLSHGMGYRDFRVEGAKL